MKDQENEAEAKIKAGFFHVSDVEVTAVKGLSCLQKSRKSLEQANKQGIISPKKTGTEPQGYGKRCIFVTAIETM